jgi:hypothetical protein
MNNSQIRKNTPEKHTQKHEKTPINGKTHLKYGKTHLKYGKTHLKYGKTHLKYGKTHLKSTHKNTKKRQ